jgi:hypothetical protein
MAFKQHDPEKLFVNVVAKRNAPTEPVEAEQITEVTEEQISDSE